MVRMIITNTKMLNDMTASIGAIKAQMVPCRVDSQQLDDVPNPRIKASSQKYNAE
jgi:hypothetical protein